MLAANISAQMAHSIPFSKKLRDALGAEAGEELVIWLQEMRAQHEELRAGIRADFAEFRSEIQAIVQTSELRLVDRIHAVDKDLRTQLASVETGVTERISRLDTRMAEVQSNLMKWSFAFWIGAVGAIAALAGVLRR